MIALFVPYFRNTRDCGRARPSGRSRGARPSPKMNKFTFELDAFDAQQGAYIDAVQLQLLRLGDRPSFM